MKKILFLIDDLFGGGAEKVLIDILKNLNPEKYEIDLFLIRNRGIYINQIPKNIKLIYGYNDNKYIKGNFYKIYYQATRMHFKIAKIITTKRISKKWINKKYDVAISFLEGSTTQMLYEMGSIDRKIAWIHTDLKKHDIIKEKLEFEALDSMDKIVCVSESAKESLIEKHKKINIEKIVVINNPIDILEIERKANELSEADKLIIRKKNNFIALGRLEHVKGFDTLIDAHKKVLDLGIEHKIFILGEGTQREALEEKIKSNKVEKSFILLGFKENPYSYMKNADFYIMPSRYEGYPLSLCEAIALEKPIITTNFQAAYEILENGKLGIIADNSSVEELKNAMIKLISDKSLQKKLINTCKDEKHKFDFSEKINNIETLLDF